MQIYFLGQKKPLKKKKTNQKISKTKKNKKKENQRVIK